MYYDLRTALEAAQTLEASDPHRPAILAALNDAANLLDLRHPYSAAFREGVAQARAQLASRVYCGTDSPVEVVAVGHTHIDVAWLWDHCQTRQKVRRSFSGMLRLFERYDAFTFFQSTPQLFRWLEKDDPSLLEALSQRIAQGRMEVDGGAVAGGRLQHSLRRVSHAPGALRQALFQRTFRHRLRGAVAALTSLDTTRPCRKF